MERRRITTTTIDDTTARTEAMDRHPAGKARTVAERWAQRIAPLMGPDTSPLDLRDGVGWASDNADLYGGDWS